MTIAEAMAAIETKISPEELAALRLHHTSLNEESKKHRIAGEEAGKVLQGLLSELGRKEGETPEAFAARLKKEREELAGKATSGQTELEKLLERQAKLETELSTWKENATKAEQARKEQEITLAVSEALGKAGAAVDALPILTKVLKDQIVSGDKGLSFKLADGSEKPVADGVKSWLEANPRFRAEQQQGGSGGGGSRAGGKAQTADEAFAEGNAVAGTSALLAQLRK